MKGYTRRRIGSFAVSLVVGLSALFLLLHALPGGETARLAPSVAADPQARAAVAAAEGRDRPLPTQYRDHMVGLIQGDLGRSIADGSPVADTVGPAAALSFQLGILAAVMGMPTGLVAGAMAALRPRRKADGVVRLTALVAVSVPSYWLAVLLLVYVGERWPDLVPRPAAFGAGPGGAGMELRGLILPALVLAVGAFGMVARTIRSALIDVLDGDDVRFARAMGMSDAQVLRRIGLRNAAPTAVTVAGMVAAGLLAGTVLVENVFGVPGLGQLLVTSFGRHDHPVAIAAASVTAVAYLGMNLVVDLVVHALEPSAGTPARGGHDSWNHRDGDSAQLPRSAGTS
ncbi:MAG: ABC transporter permease [Microthrixaceae bacterium]|nr:ABC transporter permease [Acidimicrobiales bacterium]MCB9404606.1 ABC transporter permease [Microthrixaceae bacterium]